MVAMAQELKIRITDPQALETTLQNLGTTMIEESNFTDTYFNQPEGEVFKVVEKDQGYFLLQLKRNPQGIFEVLKNNPIDHADQVIAEMTNEYGVKATLKGKTKTFTLNSLALQLLQYETLGNFLVISGENPTQDFVTTQLGIASPEYITVSFDNLQPLAPTTPAAPSPVQS